MNALAVDNVTVTYDGARNAAIESASLSLDSGQCLGVIGGNGSGKSTLALALLGVVPQLIPGHVTGEALVRGERLFGLGVSDRLRLLGYSFQDAESQLLFGTVADVLGFNEREGPPDVVRKAMGVLRVTHLSERLPDQLSSGEAQRVSFVAALRRDPHVVMLDEALGLLDLEGQELFGAFVSYLLDAQKAIMLLSQDKSLAQICSRSVSVRSGQLVPFDEASDAVPNKSSALPSPHPDGPAAIRLAGLRSRPRERTGFALGPVNLEVQAGETLVVLGPNGSGKSTLLGALSGLVRPAHDSLFFLDESGCTPRAYEWKRQVRLVTQNPYAHIVGSTIGDQLGGAWSHEADGAVDAFPYLADLDRDPLDLSFGQMRVLTLVEALFSSCRALLLDEPEFALDSAGKGFLRQYLGDNGSEGRRTIVLATHDLALAAEVADRCVLLSNGKVVAERGPCPRHTLVGWYRSNLS